jgi:hypothetical protein
MIIELSCATELQLEIQPYRLEGHVTMNLICDNRAWSHGTPGKLRKTTSQTVCDGSYRTHTEQFFL